MNRLIAAAAIPLAALGVAAPANAHPPSREPVTIALPGTDTEGGNGFCPFPVLVTIVLNNEHTRTVTTSDGTVVSRTEGVLKATATNETTGKALFYNISGPGTVTSHPDGSFEINSHGGNLLWTTLANTVDAPPVVPQLAYTTGHVRVAVAASGKTTYYHLSGRSSDVCAALAG